MLKIIIKNYDKNKIDKRKHKYIDVFDNSKKEHKKITIPKNNENIIDVVFYLNNNIKRDFENDDIILKNVKEIQNGDNISINEVFDDVEVLKDLKNLKLHYNGVKKMREVSAIGSQLSFKSNLKSLDDAIDFKGGEISIITGETSSGKSTFLNQLILELLIQNLEVFVFSGELSDFNFKRWLDMGAGFDTSIIDNLNLFDNSQFFVKNDTRSYEKVLTATEISVGLGSKVVIIDNLLVLEDDSSIDTNRLQKKIITDLKIISMKYDVHIILVAHPRKTSGAFKTSPRQQISGTQALSNLTDNLIEVMRVETEEDRKDLGFDTNVTNCIAIHKNRFGGVRNIYMGLIFNPSNKRLYNHSKDYKKLLSKVL